MRAAVHGFVSPAMGSRSSTSLFIQRPSKAATESANKKTATKAKSTGKSVAKAVTSAEKPANKPKRPAKVPSFSGGSKAKTGPDLDFVLRQAGGGNWNAKRERAARGYGQKKRLAPGEDPSYLPL